MRRGVTIVLAAAAAAAFLWAISGTWTASPGAAKERSYAVGTVETAAGPLAAAAAQEGIDQDDRLPVQLWTLVAAGGAAGLGLLLFLVRLAMGWVKRPPPQEEGHH